jgi:ubiquinone/menaquinone biosynthesis C-methylase UbiE
MSSWHKKRTVMRRYDLTACIYDMRYAREQADKIEAVLKNVGMEKHGLILDVGCGTGILFDYVADKADAILGLDLSKKTLLQATEHIRETRLANIHLIQADADNMPFCPDVFNRVFAMTILQNTPNPEKTLAEMKRVARNDAVFVVSGLKKIFARRAFERLLRNSQLKTLSFEDENLTCHVAVCANSAIASLDTSRKDS